MATTFVPLPRAIDPDVTVEQILDFVHEEYQRAWGDDDKADSVDDSNYYCGKIDVLFELENFITVLAEDQKDWKETDEVVNVHIVYPDGLLVLTPVALHNLNELAELMPRWIVFLPED